MDSNGNTQLSQCCDIGSTTDEPDGLAELPMPDCFDETEQWKQYQKLWRMSKGTARVDVCFDCLPHYRDEMIKAGRCAHPETVFVEADGEVVGVNGKKWSTWLHSVSGKRGFVVSPPDKQVRDKFIADTYRENNTRNGEGKYKRMSVRKRERR